MAMRVKEFVPGWRNFSLLKVAGVRFLAASGEVTAPELESDIFFEELQPAKIISAENKIRDKFKFFIS